MKNQTVVITEKTKNILIDSLESILDDYEIESNYVDSGGCSRGYDEYLLNIDLGETDVYELIENLERILKLCKGDLLETRDENIDVLTQEI
tara:strand:- start:64278 stop:64550 length:273 start_codon:yes stop_codon:yes gene_type:complete